jgi:hypothetical protein
LVNFPHSDNPCQFAFPRPFLEVRPQTDCEVLA